MCRAIGGLPHRLHRAFGAVQARAAWPYVVLLLVLVLALVLGLGLVLELVAELLLILALAPGLWQLPWYTIYVWLFIKDARKQHR